MAQGKKSVLLYCDLIHTIEKMDDKTAGEFFKHYLRYINDLNPTTDNIVVDLTFESVKQNLKRDLKKWEKRAENSRKNGALGGRPKKNQQEPKKPNGLIKNPQEPKKPVTDTVNVTVTDNVINKSNNTSDVKTSKPSIDFIKLLDFINSTQNRKGKEKFKVINNSVKNKYKARLKEGYLNSDIKNAIINSAKEKYHKETNYKYLTPEFFSRSTILDKYGFKTERSKSNVSVENFISNPYKD